MIVKQILRDSDAGSDPPLSIDDTGEEEWQSSGGPSRSLSDLLLRSEMDGPTEYTKERPRSYKHALTQALQRRSEQMKA